MEDFLRRTSAVSFYQVSYIWTFIWTSTILVSSPPAVSCQSVTITSNISEGALVCPGETVTFECVTRGSLFITWESNEYVGIQLGFGAGDDLNTMLSSSTDPNTIATFVNNTVEGSTRVLVSKLRIIVSSVSLTPSVTCLHGGGISDEWSFRVPGEPGVPQVTNAVYVRGTCGLNISLAAPDSFTTGDTVQVFIDKLNVRNVTHSDNVMSLTVSYTVSACAVHNVSARIIDRCGRQGPFSPIVTVDNTSTSTDNTPTSTDDTPTSTDDTSVLSAGIVAAIVVPIAAVLIIAIVVFLVVVIGLCCYSNSKKNTPKRVGDINLDSKNGEEGSKFKE